MGVVIANASANAAVTKAADETAAENRIRLAQALEVLMGFRYGTVASHTGCMGTGGGLAGSS